MAAAEGDLLVVRFSPATVEGLASDAEDSAADCEAASEPIVYSVSAFGMVKGTDDSDDDLVIQICEDAPVGGKTIFTTTDVALATQGFGLVLSEPPQRHYNVTLGAKLDIEDIKRLSALFQLGRRRNPAWKKP